MFVVISYDISDDNKRKKIAEILKDYGKRVQYSVFECNLDKKQIKNMIDEVLDYIDTETDSVRLYYICENCLRLRETYGLDKPVDEGDYIVI
ncbi:MAG: CRISPR-associated endonuclease Cas2 [Proteobacteria bacterium]|nr:CRISPR-associated endonuclease Cas2 [Pseudomonadota bacterium]